MNNLLKLFSNSELQKLLESLSWHWVELQNRGVELTSLKEISKQSSIISFLIIQLLSHRIKLGNYMYYIHSDSIVRTSPLIRKALESKLKYTIRKLS